MITKETKCDKGYEPSQCLKKDSYNKLIYEFVDLAKEKGLTVSQSQKLFIDCADTVLDINLPDGKSENKLSNLSNIEKHLASIAYSLDYFVFNDIRPISKMHPIPD